MFAELFGYSVPSGALWVSPVLGTVVFFYGGWPFLTGAVAEIRSRQPGMMLLIALAITVAFVASGLTTLRVGGLDLDFWWEVALLIVIMLLGHWPRRVDDHRRVPHRPEAGRRPGGRRHGRDRLAIRVRVDAVGEGTALAGIRRLVEQAQTSRSRAQALADRAAAALFYFATAVGAVTFAVWMLLGEPDQAIERTVTVLVIACPHALGLAIPLVIAISTAMSARAGILVVRRRGRGRQRAGPRPPARPRRCGRGRQRALPRPRRRRHRPRARPDAYRDELPVPDQAGRLGRGRRSP